MNTVTLTVKKVPGVFLECEKVNPDAFAGKTADQIAQLPAFQGKEISTLGDYFDRHRGCRCNGSGDKDRHQRRLHQVKYIGAKMTGGE